MNVINEQPKPLFWFRSNTETETLFGQYYQLIPLPIPKPQISDLVIFLHRKCGVFCQQNTVPGFKFKVKFSHLTENAISVSAEKVMAPLPIPKFNPGFGS